ncbi:helix-turn-helix domain-containing protein [Clostridium sp.]|uniref:helix-turn-helix domain-containing protein n=1 Tax=Clostridium sp. TaxID=1506 RepID=UPI001A447393|nr:helix-turn-helix domain-containing protein [Clostridium sp.]MBK5242929.1 PocR ligand-binding domain-containing protein [Clostridium sp.]
MNLLDNINKFDIQKFEWGEISWIHEPIDSPYRRLSVAQVKIYPGCQQKKHSHLGEEQLFYVEEGQGIFITDGKKEDMCKSMIVYCPPYSEHEVYNIGKQDLIFLVTYVPIKLIQLENHYMIVMDRNMQDMIPIEILKNIKDQLSEILKITINIYDENNKLLTQGDDKNSFCKICTSHQQCYKMKYASDSVDQLFNKMYKCEYGLTEIEVPITLNDNVFGYLKSDSFILQKSEDIKEKVFQMAQKLEIEEDVILTSYEQIPGIIKSRIYVIEESLTIAAQLIQKMLERSILEHELVEKDNEILISTKEKIQLKDALKKANVKMYNEKIFAGGISLQKDIVYPYELEIMLEDAIKGLDVKKIEEGINIYRNIDTHSDGIVKEMIIVLSRTALRGLEDIQIISQVRKKYDKYLQNIEKEDPWEILKYFCFDCIEEYKKILKSNGRKLIDNINMYINVHYKEDLNLNLIADLFFISPNYLSSLFNEKNHISFSNFVQNLRIEEAKKILMATNMKVKDISKKVGYKNYSYFVNLFTKNVGMTPNAYRGKVRPSN